MIAHETALQDDHERSDQLAHQWEEKAETALRRGAENVAKGALRRKIDYAGNAEAYASRASRRICRASCTFGARRRRTAT